VAGPSEARHSVEHTPASLNLTFSGVTIAAADLDRQRRYCSGCGTRRAIELFTARRHDGESYAVCDTCIVGRALKDMMNMS
jgi:hypothetical protein